MFVLLILSFLAQGAVVQEVLTQGLRKVERDAVLEKISSRPGLEFDATKVRADIEALYALGYFDGIEVTEDTTEKGLQLTYSFIERPVIKDVEFDGNENLSTSDLQEVIKIKKWSIVDFSKIQEDIELIQKKYEEKGYFLAKVNYELKPVGENGEVILIYKIADYQKVQIKRIAFLNNQKYSDTKLKSVFQETQEGQALNLISSAGTFKDSAFKNDLQRLTYHYLENGYVKFKYEDPVITVSDDKRFVTISIFVDEGEQFKMGKTEFSGDLLFTKDELTKDIQLTEGKTFAISTRNADIQRLTEKYQDLGYAFVNVVPKMDMDDASRVVNIDYGFEKGKLTYFGEIRIIGNTKTYDKVIRRELRVYEGELFSGSKLRVSKERVERLGFFAPGEVIFHQIPRKDRDDLLDLEVQVKERSTGSITLGAGYSSLQAFFFQGQIQESNLFGRGQNLSFQAQYGRADIWRSYSVSFLDPYAFDTNWSAGFDLYLNNTPIPNRYLTRRTGVQLRTGYLLTDELSGQIAYKLEHLRILRELTLTGGFADPSLDLGVLSSLTFSLVRDVRNNRFETTGGNYQSVSMEIAGVGGVKNFAKFSANNRFYWNVFGNLVFKNSTEVGAIANTGGNGIPPAEKFYLGGPFNMRGYSIFSISPNVTRPEGVEYIGGSAQAYSLFEVEHPLIREAGLKWVLFYDVGNTFANVPFVTPGAASMLMDWGFGIRWFSPLGPLRFEWGFPINRRINPISGARDTSPQFIFFIGQPF
jgi:outer membrane protein insertion porin family